MKNALLFLLYLLFPIIALSQTIEFTKAISMDVESVSFMQVAKIGSRYYAAKTGYKYLVIEGELKSTSKKRMDLPLHKFLIKSKDSTYMALADVSYIPYSIKDRFIRFKRKAHKKIYFELPETFSEGIIGYDIEKIGSLSVNSDGVTTKLVLDNTN